jgi:hypothetical protein
MMSDRIEPTLPPEVRDLARRLGATGNPSLSTVTLTQSGTMRDQPAARAARFSARQTISLRRSEFEWRASTGPFGCISVVDALKDEGPDLKVRLFRALPIARMQGGAALAKGEVMRYLAELAWAPDAILTNASLSWRVIDGQVFQVSAGREGTRGEIQLRLDENGRIGSVIAENRPRKEGAGFVERPWRGRFFDYREYQERWLPFEGEVSWLLDTEMFVAWQGKILSWRIA